MTPEPSAVRGASPRPSPAARAAVGLVGPYPPPYAGVSVTVQRLARYLAGQGVDCEVYSETGRSFPELRVQGVGGQRRMLARLFLSGPRRILHYHSHDWRVRCMVALWGMLFRRRSVISIHGRNLADSMRGGPWQRALVRFFLARTSAVIACNAEVEAEVRAATGGRARVQVVPAFIPPAPEEPGRALPADLEQFLATRSPRLLWVGWSRVREGHDLYGLGLTLDLVDRLRGRFPNLGCVLWFSGIDDEARWAARWDEVERRGQRGHFYLGREGMPEIHPLYGRADVYLRPSSEDGDSVSVREALASGTPVVASDIAPRPAACVTFRGGDAADFERAVVSVLGDPAAARERVRQEPTQDNASRILAIYRELGL